MKFAALLPNTKPSADVKKIIELGNAIIAKGHVFTIFVKDVKEPDWIHFAGSIESISKDLENSEPDVLIASHSRFLSLLHNSPARLRIFYHLSAHESIKAVSNDNSIFIISASTELSNYDQKHFNANTFPAVGGVNIDDFSPRQDYSLATRPFVVMTYDRLSRKNRDAHRVTGICNSLRKKGYNIECITDDNPSGNKADCYVCTAGTSDRGWNIGVAEAMACGLPVVSSRSGVHDLIRDGVNGIVCLNLDMRFRKHIIRLYQDEGLRRKLGINARQHILGYDWKIVADKIISFATDKLK